MKFECEVTYGFRIVSLKIANLRNKTNWDFFPAKNDMWNDMWMKIENTAGPRVTRILGPGKTRVKWNSR